MSVVTVVATIIVKKEALDVVKAELLAMLAPTRQEEGCLEYRLHQDNDDPALFVFYENWTSMACLERHLDSAHFRRYAAAVDGLLVDKVVHKLTAIGG